MAGTGVVETQCFVARAAAAAAAGGPIIDEAVVVAVVLERLIHCLPTCPLQYYCDWRQCHHVDTVVPHC